MYGTGSTGESVSIDGLWQLLTPPVGVNRHCKKIIGRSGPLNKKLNWHGPIDKLMYWYAIPMIIRVN